MTVNMWLIVLTFTNKMISEVSGMSMADRIVLDALVSAENKLRDALNSDSTPVNAFGEAVKAAETFAMQTVSSRSGSRSVGSTNYKVSCTCCMMYMDFVHTYLDLDGIIIYPCCVDIQISGS